MNSSLRLIVLTDLGDTDAVTCAVQLSLAALPTNAAARLAFEVPHIPGPQDQDRARTVAKGLGGDLRRVTELTVATAGSLTRDHHDITLIVGEPTTTHQSVLAALRRIALYRPDVPNVVLTATEL